MARDYEPVLIGLLSAASSALNDAGAPAELVHLAPGSQVVWDNCCEGGGQLYLRVIEVFPTAGSGSAFPAIDSVQAGAGCGVRLLAWHLALGVIRCAHVIGSEGHPPSAAEMSSDALAAVDDLALLLDVLSCAHKLPGIMRLKVDRWTPQGVQGGCAGGEWSFFLAIDPCLPCGPGAGS